MFIREVIETFHRKKIPYAVVGGYALAFHGLVRATMDVDLVVEVGTERLEAAESALKEMGLVSRIPVRAKEVARFRKEYIRERNLIAWSFIDLRDQTRQLDLLIRYELKDIRVKKIPWQGLRVSVADLPTLLKMKLEAGRPQDLLDAEKIREKIEA
jgi:hypothetical protein